jgi:hypothetical protein
MCARLGQWLGSDLTAMPAHPRYLRERLAGFQPAAAGVSRKRLQNVRSAVAFALDRYGLGGRRDYLAPLSPAAQALYDRLPDKFLRCRLSRLLHFISAQAIAPEQMSNAVADEFLVALEQHSAIKHVRTTHQEACRAWNKARVEIVGWPDVELTVPCYQQTWGLPWSDFPASLEAAVNAWFTDPIDDGDFFCRQRPYEATGAAHGCYAEGPSALHRLGPRAHGPRAEHHRRFGLPGPAGACASGTSSIATPASPTATSAPSPTP